MGVVTSWPFMRVAALVAAAIGGAASVGLMIRASEHPPRVLLALFVIWVIAPFAATAWACVVSTRWSDLTRTTLYGVTLVLAAASVAVYAGAVAIAPAGSPKAFIWVIVPPVSLAVVTLAVTIAARVSR